MWPVWAQAHSVLVRQDKKELGISSRPNRPYSRETEVSSKESPECDELSSNHHNNRAF